MVPLLGSALLIAGQDAVRFMNHFIRPIRPSNVRDGILFLTDRETGHKTYGNQPALAHSQRRAPVKDAAPENHLKHWPPQIDKAFLLSPLIGQGQGMREGLLMAATLGQE